MGTNYYLETGEHCPTCGRGDEEELHIGKSSAGWCFSLHVIPDEGINSLSDWERVFNKGVIFNEYQERITADDMLRIITRREREPAWDKKPPGYASWSEFHAMNHSQEGPKGMLRHAIDGRHCVGHGEGSWDLIAGEFS